MSNTKLEENLHVFYDNDITLIYKCKDIVQFFLVLP